MSLLSSQKDAELKRFAGNEAYKANDLHKAEELYAQCIQLSKQSADLSLSLALSNRCHSLVSLRPNKLLKTTLEQSKLEQAANCRAQVRLKLGKADGALKDATAALEIDPRCISKTQTISECSHSIYC